MVGAIWRSRLLVMYMVQLGALVGLALALRTADQF